MEQIKEKAYAKLNLGLDVTGKREDGYHLVSMVMQQIELCDEITVYKTADPAVSLEIDFGGVHFAQPLSDGEDNLCVRAAHLINKKLNSKSGYFIHLTKRIPIAAGMAGGSTDAAAVLRAINRLEGNGLSMEELKEAALSLGADIPYCIEGGTMHAGGIGEVLSPLPFPGSFHVLIAKPPKGCDTREIYTLFDSEEDPFHPDMEGLMAAMKRGDKAAMLAGFGNSLEGVARRLRPEIEGIEALMRENGALRAMMTGSGPTVFGLFDDEDAVKKAADVLRECGLCETVVITRFKED